MRVHVAVGKAPDQILTNRAKATLDTIGAREEALSVERRWTFGRIAPKQEPKLGCSMFLVRVLSASEVDGNQIRA